MRRHKLEIEDSLEIEKVLAKAEWGILGINNSEFPALVPLNFVAHKNCVYFHGALAGEKFELAKKHPQVSFLVVDAYAQLPSYFFDAKAACPATQLYKSVLMKGRLRMVYNDEEKASALQLLMEKLQPEGGHEPIRADSELYKNRLKGVAVIAMDLEERSAKFKLGQDQTESWRENVCRQLAKRGCPVDHQTLSEIARLAAEAKSVR
ncbi:MAG: pyridoxamine 5'-phosphate oxidase family protein [Candidatus Obscuribacterales bacterium]|nr:pyridoxamine 5'-phosphate oxidase family protein [Candidatus Obscuribacterales bacterium]